MTKSTITREQVIALIAEHSYDSALVDALEHLLAAMDSEPLAEVCEDYAIRYISNGPAPKEGLRPGDKLYRHAQLATASEPLAVTDDELNAALQLHRLKVDGHSQLSDAFRAGFRYARRTTPQPAPVVPDSAAVYAQLSDHEKWSTSLENVNHVLNAFRAAMLNGGKP